MIRRVATAGIARAVGAVANFGLSVVIGRQLGAEGAGRFFLGVTVMTLLSQVTRYGFPFFVLRHGSVLWADRNHRGLRALYGGSLRIVLALSVVVAGVAWLASSWAANAVFRQTDLVHTLEIFAVTLIPFTLLWVNAGLFKAVEAPEIANLTEAGFLPVLAVAALLLVRPVAVGAAAGVYLVACAVAALGTTALIATRLAGRAAVGEEGAGSAAPAADWKRYGAGTTIVAVCNYLILWLPFMLLARVADPVSVGAFSAAQRTVMIIGFVNVVVNSVYLTRFAPAFARSDKPALRAAFRTTTLLMVIGSAPLALACMVFPERILAMFGDGFAGGARALQFLAAGYFVSMVFGPADEVLLMFGATRRLSQIAYVVLALEAAAAIVLVPALQDQAAALITGGAFILRRLAAWLGVRAMVVRLAEPRPGGGDA